MSRLPSLHALLHQAAPTDIAGVLDWMRQIDEALPATDGIACFNHLYRTVTDEVKQAVDGGQLVEPAFLSALDVSFANLYFAALRDHDDGDDARRAWTPLFDAHESRAVAPIQFALAGMNAHINRDLPLALAEVWGARPPAPSEKAAYTAINDVLARVESEMRDDYFTGLLGEQAFAHDEEVIAMWSVATARAVAWDNGRILQALRTGGHDGLAEGFEEHVDRTFELAGRALLLA
jgi:hypothetical protein